MFWEKDYGYKAIGVESVAAPMLRQFKVLEYGE
jgi:hypothetical protein